MTTSSIRSLSLQALIAAAALALPWRAHAHDLVLVPETTGSLTVRYGHPGDWQQADKERLLDLQVGDAAGIAKPLAAAIKPAGLSLSVADVSTDGKAAMAIARYDNGIWTITPGATADKPVYHNASKAMVPQATSAVASIKYSKALFASVDDTTVYRREAKHLIELIPQRNPASVKVGETLAVLVKFNGKPLANAGVEITDAGVLTVEGQPKYTTSAAGIASVPVRQSGLNVVSVDFEVANNGALSKAMKALPVEKVLMVATYGFQVR